MEYPHPGCSRMWDSCVSTWQWDVQIFSVPETWERFMLSHLQEWPHIRPAVTPHLQTREWELMECWRGPQGRADANSDSLRLRTSPAQHEFSPRSKRATARSLTETALPGDIVYFGKSKYGRVPPFTPPWISCWGGQLVLCSVTVAELTEVNGDWWLQVCQHLYK